MKKPIYLDYNATTPVDKEVLKLMHKVLHEDFGNPSSSHFYGQQAKNILETSRKQIASLLNCRENEIIFTAGGTEANNIAIRGVAFALQGKGKHIVTSTIEHPAVAEVCNYLQACGFIISKAPVDKYGTVITAELEKLLTNETTLITIMHSNNETGSIQPIAEIAEIAKQKEIYLHTDAAQSIGKIKVDVEELGVDLLSLAGHKFYAPKGIGALYIRKNTPVSAITFGAGQENGLCPGTENVPAAAAIGKAAVIAAADFEAKQNHLLNMRNLLQQGLIKRMTELGIDKDDIKINGHPEFKLPNTLNMSIKGINPKELSSELAAQVCLSCGAACHSACDGSSKVLQAMQVPGEYAQSSFRLSTGRGTTADDIDTAIDAISSAVVKLKRSSTPNQHPVQETGKKAIKTCNIPYAVNKTAGETIASKKEEEIKLTHFTAGLGCACKIEPSVLEAVVKKLPVLLDSKTLVGPEASDDAAIYKIDDDKAIVLTLDFFNPIVDDPHNFGAIAAANSLSDIYAMGAAPLFALNIVGFPIDRLPVDVLSQILAGAIEKTNEAGIPILGGHTIKDVEPKYGLAVAGIIHPDKILANNTAEPNDAVVLTKPLGVGIITSALKKGIASLEEKKAALETMKQLNKYAADIAKKFRVSSCTDITGFGLLGHLSEVASGSNVGVILNYLSIPQIEGLQRLISKGVTPGGIFSNMDYYKDQVKWSDQLSEEEKYILFDAQTSGGLILTMPQTDAEQYVSLCRKEGLLNVSIIGKIKKEDKGIIRVF